MPPVDPEAIPDPEPVALARTLRDAHRIEELLTHAGVLYTVQVEAYARSFLFGGVRQGAMFYVAGAQAAYCRARLADAGHHKSVVDIDSDSD
jgi:hypothetical protein